MKPLAIALTLASILGLGYLLQHGAFGLDSTHGFDPARAEAATPPKGLDLDRLDAAINHGHRDRVLDQIRTEFGQRLLAKNCSLREGGIYPAWGECRNFRFVCAQDHPLSEADGLNGISRRLTLYTKYVARDAVNKYRPNDARPWKDEDDYYEFEVHPDGTWTITSWDSTSMFGGEPYCQPGPGVTLF